MIIKWTHGLVLGALLSACATAQEEAAPTQISSMGNGEANMIQIEGVTRAPGVAQFSEVRVDGDAVYMFRGDSTAITFPKVVIEQPGFLVLHPVMDGRPNGDMVSGFTYLDAGETTDVTIQIDHPADVGTMFLVMMHTDVDRDHVLDFTFVEDGINVADTAVSEGSKMIAHIFAVPE